MDHAEFSTYDGMYRAREVFRANSAVIITQDFHLPKAVYTARRLGLQAAGISADRNVCAGAEITTCGRCRPGSRPFSSLPRGQNPAFWDRLYSITRDGRATHDEIAATAAPENS